MSFSAKAEQRSIRTCISAWHLLPDTITAADVNPATSIYVAKSQLYERDDTVTIQFAGAAGDATAVL